MQGTADVGSSSPCPRHTHARTEPVVGSAPAALPALILARNKANEGVVDKTPNGGTVLFPSTPMSYYLGHQVPLPDSPPRPRPVANYDALHLGALCGVMAGTYDL